MNPLHVPVGLRCAVCATFVDIATPFPWRCPRANAADPHHVLHLIETSAAEQSIDDPNPFVRFGPRLAWWRFALAHGLTAAECVALTRQVADDFRVTPFERSDGLSRQLGVELWVKDETGNVAGSHKARHLVGILLHLLAAERVGLMSRRPRLAIASCGNAAVAAATLAVRADWPLDVYVPMWMDDAFGDALAALGATIHRCERRDDDAPGDPAVLRFREAVAAGAIPFSVQGPENALCLDGGRTLGWEIAEQSAAAGSGLDRIVVQVGGGALAACVGAGLGSRVRLDAVQAEGCAPLAAAWARASAFEAPEQHWSQVMHTWPNPHSLADGILDDETYDWIAVRAAMSASGGHPIIAAESDIVRAHELATTAGYGVSATGSAGLAGVLAIRDDLGRSENVAVVMSGVAR